MLRLNKSLAFAIICFAYATGTYEAVEAFCQECRIKYGRKMVIFAQVIGSAISVVL